MNGLRFTRTSKKGISRFTPCGGSVFRTRGSCSNCSIPKNSRRPAETVGAMPAVTWTSCWKKPDWRAIRPGGSGFIPEVVHQDGTARVQVVDEESNPSYYALLREMQVLTGNGAVLNTSMNRRGEPMVCSPQDALDVFYGSDLRYLFLGDLLVTKRE